MTSRRGAVKFNPVTGKMEAADPVDLTKHRDGSLQVDAKYVNMAKELGLGGAAGESAGFGTCGWPWAMEIALPSQPLTGLRLPRRVNGSL
jgi:hypothetical protein